MSYRCSKSYFSIINKNKKCFGWGSERNPNISQPRSQYIISQQAFHNSTIFLYPTFWQWTRPEYTRSTEDPQSLLPVLTGPEYTRSTADPQSHSHNPQFTILINPYNHNSNQSIFLVYHVTYYYAIVVV